MTTVQNTGIPGQFITGNDVHFDYDESGRIDAENPDDHTRSAAKKKKKKKKKLKPPASPDSDYPESRIITGGPQNSVVVTPMNTSAKKKKKDKSGDIWESSVEEKRALKEFWLSLPLPDQQGLMSISKDNVLQLIRDNDKINCDCSLCGRKRDAIEKELEVMYESYYDAFSAPHDATSATSAATSASFVDTLFNPLGSNSDGIMSIAEDLLSNNGTKFLDIMEKLAERRMAREFQHNNHDDHYDHFDGEDDEPCSECGRLSHEYEDEDDVEPEDDENHFLHDHFCGPEHGNGFEFGPEAAQELQNHMHGHHTTNDPNSRICHDHHDSGYHPGHEPDESVAPVYSKDSVLSHPHISALESEIDVLRKVREGAADYLLKHGDFGENDQDFEEEYEDEDEDEIYDEVEDENYENASIDEERRFEEARRMIQLFTTRMFHDRLLEKYKLKVANDRSNKLLEELELEETRKKEKEEKKLKQKEKLKEKKRLQQQAKEEEKLRKELEKVELERKEHEEKLKRAEEQRKKEEEKKLKRLEEQKKKAAELERAKKEKLEKERQKKEGKKKKDEEKKKKDEDDAAEAAEIETQRKVQSEAEIQRKVQSELDLQLEKLQQLNLDPEPQLHSQSTSTSAFGSIGESAPLHFNQFDQIHRQQVDPLSVHRQGSADFGLSMPNFTPPPPGILPQDPLNRNSIPLPQPQLLHRHPQHEMFQHMQLPSVQQGTPQPSLIPLQDPWAQRNSLIKENQPGLFENAPLPHPTNGFPSGHLNTVGLNQSLDANFNKFVPNDAPLNGFNGLNTLGDSGWSKDIWSQDNSIGATLQNGFTSRSNSLWTESVVPSPSPFHSQLLQPGQQPVIPPINEDLESSNWGHSVSIDDPSTQMVSLIQQAVVQAYQQIAQGNWTPRNVLFNETLAVLGGMVNLTMNTFLKSISTASATHWFEVSYDDYGAVSMVRVRLKGSATHFQPFENGDTQLKNVNLLGNSFSNTQPGFGDSVHNGTNEPLYHLWNSGSL